jgi:hypothetical protein
LWTSALAFPPLALGGVHPWVVALSLILLVAVVLGTARRHEAAAETTGARRRAWVTPRGWWIGTIPVVLSLAQLIPGTNAARRVIAPRLDGVLDGLFVTEPLTFSLAPADTALAVATFSAAAVAFVIAGQIAWTRTAAAISGAGTAVAVLAIGQGASGATKIAGIYAPRQVEMAATQAWLGTFVNANHQAELLLLSIATTAALTIDAARAERSSRARLLVAALLVQALALAFSGSRAGLLVGLAIAPALGWLARRALKHQMGLGSLAFAGASVVLVGLAIYRGAGAELAHTADWSAATQRKWASVELAQALLSLSPLWGLGAGGFADLSSTVDPQGGAIVQAHVESMPFELAAAIGYPGTIALIGAATWWAVVHVRAHRARQASARLCLLVGLFAVVVGSIADFGLMTLGVLLPFSAVAGAVSERDPLRNHGRRVRRVLVAASALGVVLSLALSRDSAPVRPTQPATAAALAWRPLDPILHLQLARAAAGDGRWEDARRFGTTAAALRPASVEAHLMVAVAQRNADPPDVEASTQALDHALGQLRGPAPAALASWLVTGWSPDALAELMTVAEDGDVFRRLAWSLVDVSPRHARALAHARRAAAPGDPEPERLGVTLALDAGDASLALLHARTWAALSPADGDAVLAVAKVYRAFTPARVDEAVSALERGLDGVTDPSERGAVEEALVRAWLERSRGDDLDRARELLPMLRRRPASPEARRRRSALARSLRE